MFVVPTFNLTVNIWRNATSILSPPDLVSVCQLRMVKDDFAGNSSVDVGTMFLCLPALTDVRPRNSISFHDNCEVPAGSGRIYQIVAVDDVGKNFFNEYRVALITPIYQMWSVPIA
jgi:hypothetical protein